MFRCRSWDLLCLAFGDVVEVFDDGGYGGDSAEDGEYWDHGDSPLLRFCCFSREFPGHTAICKTRAKRKNAVFKQKSQGGKIGLKALINAYTKLYMEIHFYMPYKTEKAPPRRSLKFFQQKRKLLWNGLPHSRCSLAMTFFSLTAPQGERSDHARMGIAEP